MEGNKKLRIVSFNCRSVKNCIPVIAQLCNTHDIVLLQEHWLLPHDLPLLSNIHPDFYSHALSAVDLASDILVGRPYGGTCILYRKAFTDKIHVSYTDVSRIAAIVIDLDVGPLLIANVYMPTNYGDMDSLELYVDCLSKLHALIIDSNVLTLLLPAISTAVLGLASSMNLLILHQKIN